NAMLVSGWASGAWNGTGIMSSTAAAGGSPAKTLGLAEASGIGVTTFAGEPVDSTALLIRQTIYGDANLDGLVNLSDLYLLASNWQQSGAYWWQGDFNFDGTVNATDLGTLALNWQQGSPLPGPDLIASILNSAGVPEPATSAAVSIMLSTQLPRRR